MSIESRVRDLARHYESLNKVWMRIAERNNHWPDAASECLRFEKELKHVLADEDPLTDQRVG